jgi:hypothetical protein
MDIMLALTLKKIALDGSDHAAVRCHVRRYYEPTVAMTRGLVILFIERKGNDDVPLDPKKR